VTELTFTVYGIAQPGGSKTAFRTASGKTIVRDSNKNVGEWKRVVSQAAGLVMARRLGLFEGAVALECVFFLPRPKSHHGTRGIRASAPAAPIGRPDALKLGRGTEDALKGIVLRDDSQVVRITCEKRYGEPARAEITVTPFQRTQVSKRPEPALVGDEDARE
jgi:Holliday junction resolvase RusA-like endonuclease